MISAILCRYWISSGYSGDQPLLDRSCFLEAVQTLIAGLEPPLDDPDFRVTIRQPCLVRGQIELPLRERLEDGLRLVERRHGPLEVAE